MRNPELTRNLIVEKSMTLFNLKGYRATSISDITKATGMTKGAIYGNFHNKDAVAVAAFEHATSIVMKDLRTKIHLAPTAPLKLKAIAFYYEDYIQNPPIPGGCPVINTAVEADDNYPMLRTKVVRFISQIKESLIKIIYRGIHEGQIKQGIQVEEFATTFYATLEGAIMISRVEGDVTSYQLVLKSVIRQIEEIQT